MFVAAVVSYSQISTSAETGFMKGSNRHNGESMNFRKCERYLTVAMQIFASIMLIGTAVCMGQSNPSPAPSLRAGAAEVDITPQPNERLSRPTAFGIIFLPALLWSISALAARCWLAWIRAGRATMCTPLALPRVVTATGCPADNILIAATHTHSGSTNGFSGDPTSQIVADAIVKAATEAKANRRRQRSGMGARQSI